MVVINRSQRTNLPPGGSQLPAPSGTRLRIAGQEGRDIAGAGQTIQKTGLMAQRANDDSEFQNETINMQKVWQAKQIELDKILDPEDYKIQAQKALEDITEDAKGNVGFRNKNRFDGVAGSLQLSGSKSVQINYLAKTGDKTRATIKRAENQLIQDVLAGADLDSAKKGMELLYNKALKNLAIDQEFKDKNFPAFEQTISFELFKRDVQADPKGINDNSREELQKIYGLSGENATKAKFIASRLDKTLAVKIGGLKEDVLSTIEDRGEAVPSELSLVLQSFVGDDRSLNEYIDKVNNAKAIHEDKVFIQKSTPSGMAAHISKLEEQRRTGPVEGNVEARDRLTKAEASMETELKLRNGTDNIIGDPVKAVFQGSPDIVTVQSVFGLPKTAEDVATDLLSAQIALGITKPMVAPKNTIGVNGRVFKGKQERINEFMEGKPDARRKLIADWTKEYGEHSGTLFSELADMGLPPAANMMTLGTDALFQNDMSELAGLTMPQLKKALGNDELAIKIIDEISEKALPFIKTLQPKNVEQQGIYMDLAQRYGVYRAATNRGETNAGTIAEMAVEKMYNSRYQYSGETLRMGLDVDKDQVEGFLQNQVSIELLKTRNVFLGDILEPFDQSILDTRSTWHSNGDESGAWLYIDDIPAVEDLGGGQFRPIEFKYDDIRATGFRIEITTDKRGVKRRKVVTGPRATTGEFFVEGEDEPETSTKLRKKGTAGIKKVTPGTHNAFATDVKTSRKTRKSLSGK